MVLWAGTVHDLLEAYYGTQGASPSGAKRDAAGGDESPRFWWRFGPELFRVFPGGLSRPAAELERLHLLAIALDESGDFQPRLMDLLELTVRYMDAAAGALGSRRFGQGGGDLISESDMATYRCLPPLEAIAGACSNPDGALRALDWATVAVEDWRRARNPMEPPVPPGIAVRALGTRIPLPPTLMLTGLIGAADRLSAIAATSEANFRETFEGICAAKLEHFLRRIQRDVVGPVELASGAEVTGIVCFGERHFIAFELVAGVTADQVLDGIDAATKRLQALTPPIDVELGSVALQVPAGAELVRLVIHGGLHQPFHRVRGVARMSLEDLDWVVGDRCLPDDLLHFASFLAEPPGAEQLIALDTLDVYAHWRRFQGGLLPGDQSTGAVLLDEDTAALELAKAEANRPLEAVLAAVNLPALADWSWVRWGDRDGEPTTLVMREPYQYWQVDLTGHPILVRVAEGPCSTPEMNFQLMLAQALLFRAEVIPEFQALISEAVASRPLLISLVQPKKVNRRGGLGLAIDPPNHILIAFASRLVSEAGNTEWLNDTLGVILARGLRELGAGLSDGPVQAFLTAWRNLPPSFAMGATPVYQAAQSLPDPDFFQPRLMTAASRAMAQRLRSLGGGPTEYNGEALTEWLRMVIYPTWRALLKERISEYRGDELIVTAATQLELAAAWRETRIGRSQRARRWPLSQELRDFHEETEIRGSALTRALQLLIEEAVAEPGSGATTPDRIDIQSLVALAHNCFQTAIQVASCQTGLSTGVGGVRPTGEIYSDDASTGIVDIKAWEEAVTTDLLTAPVDEVEEGPDDERGSKPLRRLWEAVDQALRADHGCGVEALAGTLLDLRTWPVSDQRPVAIASDDEVIEFLLEERKLPPEEIRAALKLLTLDRAALQRPYALDHWKFETRPYRLVTRPLIRLPSGGLLILPWWITVCQRVYLRYVYDGRLPWAQEVGPRLRKAIERLRQRYNMELEDEIAARLRPLGYRVALRVKPGRAQRAGLTLGGEIDALVLDPEERRLWVLEVKDLTEGFGSGQIYRRLNEFYQPGGFVDRVLSRASEVSATIGPALAVLAAPDTVTPEVHPLICTRRREPAAFVPRPRVAFTTIDHLVDALAGSEWG
jgi:hypothetical protein